MEKERIGQILAEKHAQDELRRMGVLVDLGDHRPYTEILAFIREKLGIMAVADVCRLEPCNHDKVRAEQVAA